MSPQGRVIYKSGRDSLTEADEQKATVLLTALKEQVAAEVKAAEASAATVEQVAPETVLPLAPAVPLRAERKF